MVYLLKYSFLLSFRKVFHLSPRNSVKMIQVEQSRKGHFIVDTNNKIIEFSNSLESLAGKNLNDILNKKLNETNVFYLDLVQEILKHNLFQKPIIFYSKIFTDNPSFFKVTLTKISAGYQVQITPEITEYQPLTKNGKTNYNLLIDHNCNVIQSSDNLLLQKNVINDLLPAQFRYDFQNRFEMAKKASEERFIFSHGTFVIEASNLNKTWFLSISNNNNNYSSNFFENAITELSIFLLDASNSDDLEATINKGLGILSQYAKSDRAYIFSIDEENKRASNIYEWCNKGIKSEQNKLQNIPLEDFSWIFSEMKNKGIAFIDNINEIPDSYIAEKEQLRSQNIQSLLCIPISKKERIIGFIGFDAVQYQRRWNKSEISLLKIAGKLFFDKINQYNNKQKQIQTESFYKNIFNNANDAMLLLDRENKTIVEANNAAKKLYNIPNNLLYKIKIKDLEYNPKDKEKKYIKGRLVLKHKSLDGKVFTVESHLSSVTLDDKNFCLLINRDISENLSKTEALTKSQQRFKMISEATSDFSFSIIRDENGARLEWCSDSLVKTFGESDLDQLKNMLHPNDKAIYHKFLFQLENKGLADVELRLSLPTQEEFWIHLSAKLYKESQQVRITGAARDINEKKKAELASKESDNRFQFLFENMPNGLITLYFNNNDYLIKNVNEKAEEIIEISKNNLIGKNIRSLNKFFNRLIENSLNDVYQKLKSKHLAKYLYENKVLEIHIYQLPNREIVLMLQDISHKSKVEKDLIESQKSYKILFNNANDSIFIHDLDGKFLNINRVACKKLGYSHHELIDKKYFELYSPDCKNPLIDRYNYLLENGKSIFETKLIRKDENLVPMEMVSRLIKYKNKIAVMTTARDITERKIAEEKLNYELQLNKSISTFAEELLANRSSVSDLAHRILHYAKTITNSAYGFVIEISEANSAKKNLILAISGEGCISDGNDQKEYAYTHELLTEQVLKTKQPFYTNQPMHEAGRNAESPVGQFNIENFLSVPVIVDEKITGQIALSNSSRNYSERDIDAIVRIANFYALAIRMERSKTELEIRNSELNNFVYKVSHDLRAPLASIAGLVNVLSLLPMDEQPKSYIELIDNRIQKLDRFINDILSHSRNLNTEITYDSLDLKCMITEAIAELNYMKEARDVKVHLQIDEGEIISDSMRIKEIIRNLLSNGFKYQNPYQKSKFIKISATINNHEVQITYEDNGLGIDPVALPKIFDMFYKASDRSNSSGLGLYIAKQAIDKLKGTINVQSEKGTGTQFNIIIPNKIDSVS